MRSVSDIINSVKRSLQSLGSPLGEFSRYSNIYALLRSIGSVMSEQDYKLAVAKESFYFTTATGDDLDNRARDLGLYRKAGTLGTGYVLVQSNNAYSLPEDLILSSADSQIQFRLQKAAVTGGGEFTLPIQSLTKGTNVNLAAGTRLYSSFFPNITFTIGQYRDPLTREPQTGITGGRDVESDFAFRIRLLLYLKNLNHGTLDYVRSAVLTLEEITRVLIQEHTPVTGYFTVYVDSQDTGVLNKVEQIVQMSKAAGVSYIVDSIITTPVNVNLLLKIAEYADANAVINSVRAKISNYFSNLSLQDSVYPDNLAVAALQVEGVLDVTVFNPTNVVTANSGTLLTLSNLSITLQT